MTLDNALPILILVIAPIGLLSIGFMTYDVWRYAEKRGWSPWARFGTALVAFAAALIFWPIYDAIRLAMPESLLIRYVRREFLRTFRRHKLRRPSTDTQVLAFIVATLAVAAVISLGFSLETLGRIVLVALVFAAMGEAYYRIGYYYVFDKDEFEVTKGVSFFGRDDVSIPYRNIQNVRTAWRGEVIVKFTTKDGASRTAEFSPKADPENVADEIRRRVSAAHMR